MAVISVEVFECIDFVLTVEVLDSGDGGGAWVGIGSGGACVSTAEVLV